MRANRETRLLAGTCRLMLACSTLLILFACQQSKDTGAAQGATELAWARAALERNPNLEVIATDMQMGVFTVRDKTTGEVHAVRLSELAAAPAAQLAAPAAAGADRAPEQSVAPAAPLAPEAKSESASTSVAQDTQPAVSQPTPTPADAASAASEPHPYTIERADGQVKVSGPGISIVSSGTPTAASAQAERGQRSVDPIICEGRRMIHLDNRDIYVEGDAITARDGCEVYITNSRIIASGTGVVVRDAVVHIDNSYVEGSMASFEVDGRARMFVRGSTFNGLSRRDSLASVQDQGGNQWR